MVVELKKVLADETASVFSNPNDNSKDYKKLFFEFSGKIDKVLDKYKEVKEEKVDTPSNKVPSVQYASGSMNDLLSMLADSINGGDDESEDNTEEEDDTFFDVTFNFYLVGSDKPEKVVVNHFPVSAKGYVLSGLVSAAQEFDNFVLGSDGSAYNLDNIKKIEIVTVSDEYKKSEDKDDTDSTDDNSKIDNSNEEKSE